ncbi:MAG: AMP-binding protein [Gammaproteobacteria bacterium]|jgi:long-chain acyl-CoA synthetase|nr:AMP-binding protein [Gammaproteobacteria bacterium]
MRTKKPWLKHYPDGTPKVLEFDPRRTLVTLLDESEAKYSSHLAFTNFDVSIDYTKIAEDSRSFAAYLQNVLGLKKGDRIAMMMPNLLQYPIAIFGALRAGLIVVNVNPLYTPRELKHQLQDSGAKAIIIFENSAHVLSAINDDVQIEHVIITKIGDYLGLKGYLMNFILKYIKRMVPSHKLKNTIPFKETLERPVADFNEVIISVDDLAFLQYTGATTGLSKGSMLSHGNVAANIEQLKSMLNDVVEEGTEIWINALPMYHIYSLVVLVFSGYDAGGLNVLVTNPRDTKGFVNELKKWPFTFFNGVNTLYESLLNHPDIVNVDFSNMKLSGTGGSACRQSTAERWQELTGKVLLEGYGLSETSPSVTVSPNYLTEFNGKVGMPIPNTEISIRDDDGNEVTLGERGEICVRGPQVMKGYWGNEEATSEAIDEDGFFKTGDIGVLDKKGFLSIVDRKKDMILVSGFNVYPNEIEDVVSMHPDIIETACIGLPNKRTGESVKIFVVRSNEGLTEKEVLEYCKDNLTGYKVPKAIEFIAELPKTNVGKVLRRALRE